MLNYQRQDNLYWKKWLTNKFNDLDFEVIPSVANFIMVKFKSAKQASMLADSLEKSNIFIRKLNNYSWTGNIRELRNVVERLMILGDNPITAENITQFTPK